MYGRAAWETSPKKVRNPYVHVNSPQKTRNSTRKLTNVTFDQAKSVTSKKQQTTPRLYKQQQQQVQAVGAVQIAPPVRAGPSSKVYRPPPVLTSSAPSDVTSSAASAPSELATSTPRSQTRCSDPLELSKIQPTQDSHQPISVQQPIDRPIEVIGDEFDREKLTGKRYLYINVRKL